MPHVSIQFLMLHGKLNYHDVAKAVERLPSSFRSDALVRENLANLQRDVARWLT